MGGFQDGWEGVRSHRDSRPVVSRALRGELPAAPPAGMASRRQRGVALATRSAPGPAKADSRKRSAKDDGDGGALTGDGKGRGDGSRKRLKWEPNLAAQDRPDCIGCGGVQQDLLCPWLFGNPFWGISLCVSMASPGKSAPSG